MNNPSRPETTLRKEDSRLLSGRTRFTDDVHLEGMVHGVFVRSTMAHARIIGIDTSAATEAGALLVLTADALPFADRNFFLRYSNPNIREGVVKFLAKEYVRYVGEPIAFIVASDRYVAEDLAALVEVDLEPIDVVATTEAALENGAPQLHPRWERNIAAQFERVRGNPQAELMQCEHTLTRRFFFGRQTPLPLETRGCVADFDVQRESLCLYTSSQTHYAVRQNLSALLDLPETSIRVVAEHVGGSFGSKSRPYPEEMIVSHASRVIGRPVKWIEDRFENMQATTQSRAIETELTIGYDNNGKLLALTARMTADIGAYVYTSGIITAEVAGAMICGPYRIPHAKVEVLCVGTNKTPLATFRGAGQPEAAFPMECLLDLIAKDLGISPYELRRRNIVSPEDYPYPVWAPGAAGVSELESCDYPGMLARTVADSGYSRKVESLGNGEVAAWGLACGLEITGFINFESAKVRIEPTGTISVWSGITSQGEPPRVPWRLVGLS
ncbi:xanthine dehydrogenase family protein molybdopterin-binding subunit [Eoetvoesiella caeni]